MNITPFTHEQTQALLAALEQYELWVADAEYRADVKSPQIMDGLTTIAAAAKFIRELDADTQARADKIERKWDRAAEMDEDI